MATSASSFAATSYSASRHHHVVTVRVLVAETGATYKISLPWSDLTVANLRSHLAAAVPLSDQILLLGPPYKVPKDPVFQSEEILNSLRLGDMEDDPIHEEQDTTAATATTSQDPANAAEAVPSPSLDQQQPSQPRSLLKLPRRRLLGQSSFAQRTPTSQFATGSTSSVGVVRRLFLFSKSTLSAAATPLESLPPCRLSPQTVALPTDVQGPSPLADALASASHASSPLHQALVAYEGQFRKYLEQGRVLADAADLRVESCVLCLQEQAVMARALQAAVSNLSDHATSAHRARSDFANLFHAKTSAHAELLQGFEGLLHHLSTIPLHPALVRAAEARVVQSSATMSTAAAAASPSPSSSSPRTLLDTVPVERERSWMLQCRNSHERLVALSNELEADFAQWSAVQDTGNESDNQAVLQLEQLWEQVQGTGKAWQKQQAQRLEQLTASHSQVVKTILKAVQDNQESSIQAAFVPLGELSETSKGLVPAMLQTDGELLALQQSVAESKTRTLHRLRVRLREVSAAQSGIQKALSNLSVLKDALKQQSENMEHIEHVAELPSAYQQFLEEIRRRRAFGQAVAASSTALLERVAAMREDEVKARERFLRGPGRHLMPAFYEVFVPTLASPPPLFAPQLPLNELDALPDLGDASGSGGALPPGAGTAGEYSSMQVGEHGISSASSLTTSGQQGSTSQAPDQEMSSGMGGPPVGGGPVHPPQQQQPDPQQQQQQQEQLIVSASEQSANDLYLDPATGAAAEAEARTLAYENMILRQALERLGGKPSRAYLQEARATSSGAVAGGSATALAAAASAREEKAQAELAALRQELAETQMRARAAADAFRAAASTSSHLEAGGMSDKISHSSFQVGDVGLFMPTGRGSGGKRTYLAFHTKCPYRFLSTDNIKGTPDYVLGRIVYQEELVAGELGTDANPYGLPVGTKFWVMTVEVLTSQT